MRLVEEYIALHAAEPIDMQTIARVTGHSTHSIFRAFRKYRDYTPTQFLSEVRLNMARQRLLLSKTANSVRTIAMECGFAHVVRCSIAYKRRYGESPSDTARKVINRRI